MIVSRRDPQAVQQRLWRLPVMVSPEEAVSRAVTEARVRLPQLAFSRRVAGTVRDWSCGRTRPDGGFYLARSDSMAGFDESEVGGGVVSSFVS